VPLTQSFADSLKHYREAAGLSQEDLAAAADLDRTYISMLERGLKSPTLTTIEKLSSCLGTEAQRLVRPANTSKAIRAPRDYIIRGSARWARIQRANEMINVRANLLVDAVGATHDLIDDIYAVDLDIAEVLGMRNLSAFIGELYAAALIRISNGLFVKNPHQDGYPDLLLLDNTGKKEWAQLAQRRKEKAPFSPFAGGGIEVKATCGSVPTPAACKKKGFEKPDLGDRRIGCMMGYDWKAHHRDTNNLIGLLWDFLDARPRIAAVFFSSDLRVSDWGEIVQPKDGGGRTTSVSIMGGTGIRKMYEGWICVLKEGGYREFLNRRNRADLIPEDENNRLI
jgi:transcriptional regulator with XRE-family HTH domain